MSADLDLQNKMDYEQQCLDSGIHVTAIKTLIERMGYKLLNVSPRLTENADWLGIDVYFTLIDPKTHKAKTFDADIKFRDGSDYGDVLFNWIRRGNKPGWAHRDAKKVNDVVLYIVRSTRKIMMIPRKDMHNAFDYLNRKPLVKSGDQSNVMMSYEECRKHFPNFVGPVIF